MSAQAPGQLLFAFVRHWSRRSGDGSLAEQGRLVLATEAVSALVHRGETATVNAVAEEIGIDQSGASRLIKSAIGVGYLTMSLAPSDARKREVALTRSGRMVLQKAHAWQEHVFDELTPDWNQQRRDDFQAAMTHLMARSHAINE